MYNRFAQRMHSCESRLQFLVGEFACVCSVRVFMLSWGCCGGAGYNVYFCNSLTQFCFRCFGGRVFCFVGHQATDRQPTGAMVLCNGDAMTTTDNRRTGERALRDERNVYNVCLRAYIYISGVSLYIYIYIRMCLCCLCMCSRAKRARALLSGNPNK